MFKALAEGVVWGIILSFMIGPVFFGLLHTSIHKGFRKGMIYASGVASSDTFFIVITYFGIAGFMDDESFRNIMMILGGLIMCTFGMYYILKRASDTLEVENEKKQPARSGVWMKGFLLNSINPSVFLFWIGMVSFATVQFDKVHIFTFFVSIILTVFGMDVLKSFIANKIKIYFTNKLLNKMNKILGIIILVAGAKLLYDFVRIEF